MRKGEDKSIERKGKKREDEGGEKEINRKKDKQRD